MPKQHNALYGDDLHNPKGMTVDSHASSSKFVISASNMTITASGFTVKATAFQGDGSGLTGVPANDWDGTHAGNGVITGNLEVQGNSSGSFGSTGSWGKVVASKFYGNGANIVGVTAEWDGSHTGNATFTGNVTASGVVSASGGFVGDGSNLTGLTGGIFVATGSIQAYTGDVHITGSVKVGDPGSSTVNDAGDHIVNYSTYQFFEPQLPSGDGSYTHALSTGDRQSLAIAWEAASGASVTDNTGWNGTTNGGTTGFRARNDGTQVGNYATLDMGASYYVSEIKAHWDGNGSSGGTNFGNWKWQGSNDNSNWTDIGPAQNVTSSYANQTGITTAITSAGTYRYYKWIATVAGGAYLGHIMAIFELDFKIKGSDPVMTRVLEVGDGGTVSGSSASTGSFGRVEANAGLDVTGNIAVTGTVDTIDIATRDAILTSTTTTAGAALPKAGGAMTGAITTNSTFDGVDIATRDGILTSTTTTAGAALPKAGGTMTGELIGTSATFTGDITAKNYIVSSSVTYMTQSFSSGSTIFGDTISDTHQFTGSILVGSGSISGSSTSTASFGTFVGDGSSLTGVGGGGLTHNFSTSQSLAAGDGVIINADGWVKKIEEVATPVDIPLKAGTAYNTAGYEFDSAHANYTSKFITYDPQQADIFVIAWEAIGNSSNGKAIVGTISGDDGLMAFGTAGTFHSAATTVIGAEYIPGQSTKFVVYYHKNTSGANYRNAARVGSISGTGNSATISWGTEVELPTPSGNDGRSYGGSLAMDPNTAGKFVVLSRQAIVSGGIQGSGSAWVGTVSGTSITMGSENQYESDRVGGKGRLAADPNQTGKFAILYVNYPDYALKSKVATLSGTSLSFGAKTAVNGYHEPASIAFDPNDTGKLIATYITGTSNYFHAGILSGTGITWGTADGSFNSGYEAIVRFNPLVKGQWAGVTKWAGGSNGYLYVVKGTLSGTAFSSGTTVNTHRFLVGTGPSTNASSINIAFDSQKSGKFTLIFGGHGGYETGKGRASAGQLDVSATNLTTSNWGGMATGVTAISGSASITTRGGVATGVTGSGLIPGTIYYLQGNSSLATTADTPSVKAGRALSATSIILTPSPINVDGTPYATSTQGDTADTALTNAATAQTTANAALPKAGGTMTGGLIGTTATFTGNVSSSLTSTGSFGMVLAGGTALASADGFDYTSGSSPVVTTNPSSVGATWINTTSGEIFVAIDITAGSNTWKGTGGTTVESALFYGSRGVFAGGQNASNSSVNTIDYITIASTGNATDFGDMNVTSYGYAGCSDGSRGVIAGSQYNNIDYITIATPGNATDFGDLTTAKKYLAACSNGIRGIWGGGTPASTATDTIEYVTIASTGNASDYGDLTAGKKALAALSDGTKGVFGGGTPTSWTYLNNIDYITIATGGTAADFGDLTVARRWLGAAGNITRGLFVGGGTGSDSNVIDYITTATAGNATDFGNLSVARESAEGCTDGSRACFGGSDNSPKTTIDYVTIATTGNALDFGDLSVGRETLAALAGS